MTSRSLPRAAVLLAAALAACGGDGDRKAAGAPVRIEVIYATVDPGGPVDGFSLLGEDGRTWPLASQPALDRRVLAAGAPGGRYRVAGPPGWAPVGPLESLPLRGDLPPNPLWVGRTYSVYLIHPPDLPVTEVDARREDRETGPRPLDARLETGSDGRSALRIPADQWDGTMHVRARLGATHFARPVRVTLKGDGAPFHATTEPSLMTTFDVLALPPGGVPAAGLEVEGRSRIGRLEARAVAKTNLQGWARLDPVPVEAEDFSLAVAGSLWPGNAFRSLGEARLLLAPPPAGPGAPPGIAFEWPQGGALVQVRPEGSDSYAAVPGPWVGSRLLASLRPGRHRWIVTHGSSAAFGGPIEVADADVTVEAVPAAIATLSVHIRGGFETSQVRYDLHARRLEDGKEVSVVGGTLRGLLRRDADLSLPPGRWRVRLALGAKESAPKDVDLSTPGDRASIDLDAPR